MEGPTRPLGFLTALPEVAALEMDLAALTSGGLLHEWIELVRQHELPALRQFADGLLHDRDAVIAGLSSTWSSGQVEGQVTRVKLIKRKGYGRANFDLLRRRILLAD
ncbi:transposase [Streptomyces sp. NPDC048430]|uniref:transposase n=1 Tax=Streptomyces sp. NPDC048430 TaxID=3155388 RepID=UPI0034193F38